ncbi:hypothetical protein ACLD9W_08100, partial [Neisseria sp. WLZKY-1]|uniref:hypothetical protein n=1 Tax=Neisseria sp. WLZKY-1 TaxID=3390377 RepID=UPI0039789BB1
FRRPLQTATSDGHFRRPLQTATSDGHFRRPLQTAIFRRPFSDGHFQTAAMRAARELPSEPAA